MTKQNTYSPSQSLPLILVMKSGVGLRPWKKMGYPVFCQKAGCKKPGHCYSKRKRQPGLFSFWITMTLIFAPCFLAKNRVPDFLKVQDPKKISGWPDKLDIRVQIDWAIKQLIFDTSYLLGERRDWAIRQAKSSNRWTSSARPQNDWVPHLSLW